MSTTPPTGTEKPPLSRIPLERELAILTFGGGWLVITLVIEGLSYLRGLAPPDPYVYRLGLGIPALLLVASMFVLGPRLDEQKLARGFTFVLFMSLLMGWVIVLITPATFAIFFQFCTTLTAAAFFATRRGVVIMAVGLSGAALLPAVVRLHALQPHNVLAWLIVFLPLMWTIPAVVFLRRAKLNRAINRAQELSLSDPLTGLANLHALRAAIESTAAGAGGGLLLLDLDNFKTANTLYGHLGGDHALRTVAQALRRAARPDEIVARVGGDELAIFAPTASASGLEERAAGYRAAVKRANDELDLPGVTLDASVGVARRPQDGLLLADLLTAADRSMYAVKATRHTRRGGIGRTPAANAPAASAAQPRPPSRDPREIRAPRSRDRDSLAWAVVVAVTSAAVLLSVLVSNPAAPHARGAVAWCAIAFLTAATIAILHPSRRALSHPGADVASILALVVLLYLTGGLQSQAYPLVLLIVLQQSVATPPRGIGWRVLTPIVIALTPLAYQHNLSAEQWPETVALLAAALACSVTCAVAPFICEQALGAVEERANHHASTDPLTELPNRREFTSVVEATLRRNPERFAVLMIDLDDFADVNTTFGHQAGDQLLREIADALGDVVRANDCLARIGGDEFAVVLPDVDEPTTREVAARFLTAVSARTAPMDAVRKHVRASAGFALYPDHGRTLDELIARADAALMEAKSRGKGILRSSGPSAERVVRPPSHRP